MATKVLPIILPPAVYARLEERAAVFEREPLAEARWLIRAALGDTPAPATVERGTEDGPPSPRPAA